MRIILADHHKKALQPLRMLISERTDHIITGETADWQGLLELTKRTDPDLILLDWDLPGRTENNLVADLRARDCYPKVLVLSTRIEVKEKALEAGADAFISKGDSPQKLLDAIQTLQNVPPK